MRDYDYWLKAGNPWSVVAAAPGSEGARQAALTRIIDTMLELQLDHRHISPGWPAVSIAALAGEMPGGGGGHDQMLLASMRYSPDSEWHRACAMLLRKLPRRQAAAMLLQAARIRPDKAGESVWMVTARQLVERQALLLRQICMAEGVAPFESVEALEVAARRARNRLRQWLADEIVPAAA
ncbi:hypothetical protein HPA02_27310 [Bisbaumannia pacifica]|uniref:Uncharacterized protein n=1 Tax=Bisbaumannia pacifica TaxID=77098 RepID=A0A510XAJ6_9GAMM|nr:hypothetical protein [Halomonas pacifica]GEK48448.1 hypothetical protein HPA02_27310 [Halomonas pacifica]